MDTENSNHMLAKSNAPIHGNAEQIHSTRGELFGILACLRYMKYLDTKFNLRMKKKIQLFVFTDSSSSISIAKTPFYMTSKTANAYGFDIKCKVRHLYKDVKTFVEFKHVRGHQDSKVGFKSLSKESKLNVLTDKYATKAAECSAIKHKAKIPHLPLQQVSLSTPYKRITRNVDEEILKLKVGNNAEEYLQRRWKIDDAQMKKVLWNDIRSVIIRVPNHRKTQYSKILHKIWSTMKRNHD